MTSLQFPFLVNKLTFKNINLLEGPCVLCPKHHSIGTQTIQQSLTGNRELPFLSLIFWKMTDNCQELWECNPFGQIFCNRRGPYSSIIIIIFILKTLGYLSLGFLNIRIMTQYVLFHLWFHFGDGCLKFWVDLNFKNRTFVQMHCTLYHKLISQRKSSQNKYAQTLAFFSSSFCLASCKFLWGKKKLCYHKHNE